MSKDLHVIARITLAERDAIDAARGKTSISEFVRKRILDGLIIYTIPRELLCERCARLGLNGCPNCPINQPQVPNHSTASNT